MFVSFNVFCFLWSLCSTFGTGYPGYIAVNEYKTWSDAHAYCIGVYGTSLATIRSSTENDIVVSIGYASFGTQTLFWIGLNDIDDDGNYEWIDGTGDASTIYTKWDSGQPDTSGSSKNCVEMLSSQNWNNNVCSLTRPFICNLPYQS